MNKLLYTILIIGFVLIVVFSVKDGWDVGYRINKAYDDGYKDAMDGVYNRAEKLLK